MRFSLRGREIGNGATEQAVIPAVENLTRSVTALEPHDGVRSALNRPELIAAKLRLHRKLIDEINLAQLDRMSRAEIRPTVLGLLEASERVPLNTRELGLFVDEVIDELTGLGPLEPLLKDPTISDILINTHESVYVERDGVLEPAAVRFKDEAHVLRIVNKIVAAVGRRVDESSPMVDARLQDGSRINAAIRPVAVDGPLVSIRKFAKQAYDLTRLVENSTLKPPMAALLREAVKGRLSMMVSGGTGSGKTTLLNALSRFISNRERIITIEDAAELQLQQPHVGRLETRPPNLEGKGEIRQRELVKNALRMRPDRILIGEVRGEEAFDMLNAMNTGHEGSLTTIHANTARDAIARLEQMVAMAGLNMSEHAVRAHIASAIRIIVQMQRLHDGQRKITSIHEITGLEGSVIQMQELYRFVRTGADQGGTVKGEFRATGLRPSFLDALVLNGANPDEINLDPGEVALIQALAPDTVIYFVIFACYLLAIQGVVMSYARYSQQRSLIRSRLQTGVDTSRHARAAPSSRGATPPLRRHLTNSVVRAGLSPKSRFVPLCAIGGGLTVFLPLLAVGLPLWIAASLAPVAAIVAPIIGLKIMRIRYLRAFEAQLPEAIDTLIRSLRAGHPVSASLRLVCNLPAPIGEAFAIVSDEVTYGLDLETAMRNMQVRVNQQDVALLVSAISLQVKTGGNLAELLERLSKVIRERQRMRLKARALSAEARFSAIALSVLPILLFTLLQFIAPGFYGGIWKDWLVAPALTIAAVWLVIGNVIMFRMVRFDI